MPALTTCIADRTCRWKVITILSGALLLAGVIAGRVDAVDSVRYPLLLAAALIAGSDIAARAIADARRQRVTIEQLVTIAAVGAIAIGEVWEAAAVTFLFMFGAWLEARTMSRTRRALARLLEVAPERAFVVRDGETVEISPVEVRFGETVLVRPGDRVPVDGTVRQGSGAVNESAITGEPLAAEKVPGDRVFAGSVNQDGMLFVEATGVGADTTLARIIERVEEAQDDKAPAQKSIERFARWYTPTVIGLAVIAGVVTRDVELALTLLVIGCPGALVMATPVAVIAGIGRAARRGILIKGGEHLEAVGNVTTIAFDKTGTLTEGKPVVTDVVALQPAMVLASGDGPFCACEDVLKLAAIAETGSSHPLARPIIAAARQRLAEPIPQGERGAVSPGRGITATWEGRSIGVGTPELMEERSIAVTEEARRS